MGKITLISGPIKSGKTRFAEQQALESNYKDIIYLATQANAFMDEGMRLRIENHQAKRPDHWRTVEAFSNLDGLISILSYDRLIFDCVTVWATNLFFDELSRKHPQAGPEDYDAIIQAFNKDEMKAYGDLLMDEMKKIVVVLKNKPGEVWIVSNELGWTLTPTTILGSLFVDYIGQINQYLANEADQVLMMTMGLAQRLK